MRRIFLLLALLWSASAYADESLYMQIGGQTRPPIGWVEFCARPDGALDCKVEPVAARDVVLTGKAWADLVRVNRWANAAVKPKSDLEHYGVLEKWAYPNDGYGDCEDYVLLKRRLLLEAGWPRSALLITVVRDKKGEGHAVLTVKSDRGEFVLDNQAEDILLWSETGYRFVKRQSETNPNVWVAIQIRESAALPLPDESRAKSKETATKVPIPRPRPRYRS